MQDFYEPKVGDVAPNFRLPSTEGGHVSLSDYSGKEVILYFYPKDDTPGCTAQACSLRDSKADIDKEGAVVLGVSTDSIASHEKFRKKFDLNFPLLADETSDVSKMYGVWKEKNMYGRKSWGVARRTYLIGADGRIRKIFKKVETATHGPDLLGELKAK
ncbi:MAG TPA: thioredoxin-dependent thiol peroxidase [Thermoanaerobaculia bacterium]|nr:thioredoxin-dependent thiol peroxidase [Thermoanaerobaculia bacterium]